MSEGIKDPAVKEPGPKFPKPQQIKTPKASNYLGWAKSINSQIAYEKRVLAEAEKSATIRNYKPQFEIPKRYKEFFNDSVLRAQQKANRKRKA